MSAGGGNFCGDDASGVLRGGNFCDDDASGALTPEPGAPVLTLVNLMFAEAGSPLQAASPPSPS